ncbi:MAG TPA: trypsin-like peptidase domain-containing protein [Planctomycetota bacterium]|nr:trypsin-like peptidase domain-containing protein [Planctomycetota bacterium]
MAGEVQQGWRVTATNVTSMSDAFDLAAEGLTFGRDPSNDVALPSERYPGVSAHHARLVLGEDGPVLEDLASRNGTLVGGEDVERRRLVHGQAFELGEGGPRFVILLDSGLDRTAVLPRTALAGAGKRRSIGTATLHAMREELGIPTAQGVDGMLRRRTRMQMLAGAVLVLVTAVAAVWIYDRLRGEDREIAALFEERERTLEERIAGSFEDFRSTVEAHTSAWRDHGERLDDARRSWEQQKAALMSESDAIEAGIRRLEAGGIQAEEELAGLRAELAEASLRLGRFDPLNLEQAKLELVGGVERCVVLIEARKQLVSEESGAPLFIDTAGAGSPGFNFEGLGEPFSQEGSGSGFCVSADGWIVTNAHVVFKLDDASGRLPLDDEIITRVELEVVFTGSSMRHAATIEGFANTDKEDLALIRIEPFEGMPHLADFSLETPLPARGSEVFLIGFPLGTEALQEGDTVLASTFRGIVSRSVDYYLQVDAAVHPGASGGPVIDGQGRVLGVVTGMQVVDTFSSSSAIGYVIPVAEVGKLWPPR